MPTAAEQLAALRSRRTSKIQQILATKKQLQEIEALGRRDQRRKAVIRDLSNEITKLDIGIDVAKRVIGETRALSPQQQTQILASEQAFAASQRRAQVSASQQAEAQTKALRLEARKVGLEPIRIRGQQFFRDLKTKKLIRGTQLKSRTSRPLQKKVEQDRVRVEKTKKLKAVKQLQKKTLNILVAPNVPLSIRPTKSQLLGRKTLNKEQLEFVIDEFRKRRTKIQTDILRDPGFKLGREAELAALTAGTLATEFTLGVKKIIAAIPKAPKKIIDALKKPKVTGKAVVEKIKTIPKGIERQGEEIGRVARISPTELLVEAGGQLLFLKGSGKVFEVVGEVSPSIKVPSKLKKEKGSKVVLVGTQKQVGGKIVTNIVFKTDKGIVGKARGVTVQKGKDSVTFTLGKAGKPDKKGKLKKQEVFIGFERGVSKPSKIKFKKEVKGVGTVIENLEGIAQASFGRTAQVKGDKLVRKVIKTKKGKRKAIPARKLKVKDFVSISSVLTRKDISLITGKTLTSEKDRIKFLGLIKGIDNVEDVFSTLSPKKRLQFKKALQDVVGTITASTVQSQKIITQLSPKVKFKLVRKGLTKTSRQKIKAKAKRLGRTAFTAAKVRQVSKAGQKVKPRVTSKAALRKAQAKGQKFKQTQKTAQLAKQASKQALLKKLALQSKAAKAAKAVAKPGFIPRIPKKPKILGKFKKKKRKLKKKVLKGKEGYNVFGKSKGKFIKINKKPLSKRDALNRGAFALDHTTSKTLKLKKAGKVKKLGKVTKSEKGYFAKKKSKFRETKIRKGKPIKTPDKFIERRRFGIDTKGEKRQLSLSKFAKQKGFIGKPKKRKSVPKRKPVKRKTKTIKRRGRKKR